jgi:choline dehydrogenase-like flavoprotein
VSWTAIQAAYKRIETFMGGAETNADAHGSMGRLQTRTLYQSVPPTSFAQKMTNAFEELTGLPPLDDYNDLAPSSEVGPFLRWQVTVDPVEKRSSSATAFMSADVMQRPNLYLFTETTGLPPITFNGNKKAECIGATRAGQPLRFCARKEMIVSASVYSSVILELSGIGDATVLAAAGVPLVHHNPFVGENLYNHEVVVALFTRNGTDGASSDPTDIYGSGAWLPTPNPAGPPFDQDDAGVRRIQVITIPIPGNLSVVAYIDLQPQSKGFTHIQSADPLRTAYSDDNLLSDPNGIDLETYKNMLKEYALGLHNIFQNPGPNQDTSYFLVDPSLATVNDDDALTAYVVANLQSHAHHWHRQCQMRVTQNDGGVVDSRGRVFGVQGLRVVDVSIAPYTHDGNTVATAYLIAEIVGDDILASA